MVAAVLTVRELLLLCRGKCLMLLDLEVWWAVLKLKRDGAACCVPA